MASSSETIRPDGACAVSGAAMRARRIPILVERMCTCLATATPVSGDALPGTVRQRRRPEAHGAHEGIDVSRCCLVRASGKGLRHHVAIERVAEHRAHDHGYCGFNVRVRIRESV